MHPAHQAGPCPSVADTCTAGVRQAATHTASGSHGDWLRYQPTELWLRYQPTELCNREQLALPLCRGRPTNYLHLHLPLHSYVYSHVGIYSVCEEMGHLRCNHTYMQTHLCMEFMTGENGRGADARAEQAILVAVHASMQHAAMFMSTGPTWIWLVNYSHLHFTFTGCPAPGSVLHGEERIRPATPRNQR